MRNQRRVLLLVPPLLTLLLGLSGCPKTTLRTAIADIAGGLATADKSVQTLYSSGAVTKSEAVIVEGLIREATVLNDKLNACADVPTTAATCVSSIELELKTKQAEMVLGIKDPKAQADFQIALALFDQGLVLLDNILAQFRNSTAVAK